MNIKTIVSNINSILKNANVKQKVEEDEISKDIYSIDIPTTYLNTDTIDKIVRVCEKYKAYDTHTVHKNKLRVIFAFKKQNESMIKNFDQFVNENYYIKTPANQHETKTQKIIYPVNEYEIGERVQVSIYADNKRKGETGYIATPEKFVENSVCIEFQDGKKDYFLTTEINRI